MTKYGGTRPRASKMTLSTVVLASGLRALENWPWPAMPTFGWPASFLPWPTNYCHQNLPTRRSFYIFSPPVCLYCLLSNCTFCLPTHHANCADCCKSHVLLSYMRSTTTIGASLPRPSIFRYDAPHPLAHTHTPTNPPTPWILARLLAGPG